jgi:hypothetical protein
MTDDKFKGRYWENRYIARMGDGTHSWVVWGYDRERRIQIYYQELTKRQATKAMNGEDFDYGDGEWS